MEGPYIDYIAAQYGKPVLATGPLVPEPPRGELEERFATWLSSFPDKAVVFALDKYRKICQASNSR
uniref:Uncharacterized protein n=1 Tax=Oryza barthii TaxID=65489 RepID=A0A0D3HLK0_9ORYZ